MNHSQYILNRLSTFENHLGAALRTIASRHPNDYHIRRNCILFAGWSENHLLTLQRLMKEFENVFDPGPLSEPEFPKAKPIRGMELLQDLENLMFVAHRVRTAWIPLEQAAKVQPNSPLAQAVPRICSDLDRVIAWVQTEIKNSAPQALTVI